MKKMTPSIKTKPPRPKRMINIIVVILVIILLFSVVSYFTAKYYTARVNVTQSLEDNTSAKDN